jgi:hypothetical protein
LILKTAATTAIPPKIRTQPSLIFFAATVFAAVIVGASAVVFFFDPTKSNFYPVCTFHRLTGLNCPGCGGTRALHALLHGDFSTALRDNALFIFALGFLTMKSIWFCLRKIRNRAATFILGPKTLWTFLALAIIFTILRNLPEFSFLSP